MKLNDDQAQKICEIVNLPFHHFTKSKGKKNQKLLFYSTGHKKRLPSFTISMDGDILFDDLGEKLITHFSMDELKGIKIGLPFGSDSKIVDDSIERLRKHLAIREQVKNYLSTQNLI